MVDALINRQLLGAAYLRQSEEISLLRQRISDLEALVRRLEPLESLLAFMSGSDDPILQAMLSPEPAAPPPTQPPPPPAAIAPAGRDAAMVADSMVKLMRACAAADGGDIGDGTDASLLQQLRSIESVLAGRPPDSAAADRDAAAGGEAASGARGGGSRPTTSRADGGGGGGAAGDSDSSYDEEVAGIGTSLQATNYYLH